MIKRLILLAAFLLLLPADTQAQNSSDTLEGYVPPPMFGAPRPIPPKQNNVKPTTLPKLSTPVENIPTPEQPDERIKTTPKVEPKPASKKVESKKTESKLVIPIKKPEHPKEKFEAKPEEKLPEIGIIEKNKVKPGIEPIDLIKKSKPAAQTEGIVKGPKTMPSNKKQNVESEVLFEPKNLKQIDLIDRVQKKDDKENVQNPEQDKIIEPKNPNFDLPKFSVLADGQRKLNIIFAENQKDLADEQIYTLQKLILPLLKENKATRLRLESYASPQGQNLNGDRRLALSRAMAIRDLVLNSKIDAHRLDVRSLGAQTDVQPMDRVEIYIVEK